MGIVRDLYYARKMSAGLKLPAPTVALLIKRLRLAAAMGGGVTKTVSGTMVHITDALAKAALSVLVNIIPIQDLHGYSSPWPGGGGKNKCVPDLANGQIGSNGGYSSNTSRLTNAVRVDNAYVSNTYLSAGTYTLSADGLTQCTVLTKDASANIIDNFATDWHDLPYTFTMTAAGYVFFTVRKSSGDLNPDDYKAQIESGSTATSWESYENICPITGRTGLDVYRTGKNWYSGGNVTVTNDLFTNVAIDPIPAGTYTVSAVIGTAVTTCRVAFRKQNGSAIEAVNIPYVSGGRSYATITLPETAYRIYFYYAGSTSGTGNQTYTDVQIELGSTSTAYEPYTDNTYAVDWTTEAGTVYGGTLDVVTGVLTVTHEGKSISDAFSVQGDGVFYLDYKFPANVETTLCSWYKTASRAIAFAVDAKNFFPGKLCWQNISSGGGSTRIAVYDTSFASVSDFNTALTANPMDVVYELATPLTYQLTAQEVQMLLGENYVWSSSGDAVSVTYYAEGNANDLQSLNILLGGNYSNPKTADDVSDKEALEIILGGNK